ncbi:MAG: 30S ribosomal protein S12 methylthiotransferase RimO [Lachnospiraceae bacterium]|nr:30S ribosomal protein S12 methylthiotransferase RimO [Lachnospiraceae bacterium]
MSNARHKIMLVSLGCDKNLVDSEMMLGMLSEAGFEITNDEQDAEVVIVNTCCFIMDAKEESITTLIEYGKLKETAKCKALIATGCLAQRYADEIHKEIPEVDAVVGTSAFDKIIEVVQSVLGGEVQDAMTDLTHTVSGMPRVLSTGGHYAYLKIAEGCNKRCTYCIIPSIRGNYRSVPMETLIAEAKQLAEGGVRELILVAQETTLYGIDLYGEKTLPKLLRELAKIEDLKWIRLLYCYPEEITDELIETIAAEPKICHYLDLPIQHSEDEVLKRMGRRTRREELESTIAKIRNRIPDICLRTTLICGFPQETEEDYGNLKSFVEKMRFERLGVFPYSPEEGTPAEQMDGQIDEAVKKSRAEGIMALQQEIAFEQAQAMEGRVLECIVEGRIPEENVLVCRSYMDAPDVDGYVFVDTEKEYMSGTIVRIKVTGSEEYDLIGEFADESAE